MSNLDENDKEPPVAQEPSSKSIPAIDDSSDAKSPGLLSNLKQELTEEEIKSPVVTKFLWNQNLQLIQTTNRLQSYEVQFHEKDKEVAILLTKLEGEKRISQVQKFCITIGGLLLGTMKLISGQEWYVIALVGFSGILLLIAGLFIRDSNMVGKNER